MSETILPGTRGEMPVHVATPDGEGPWPGVVVVADALGMTRDLRNQADWLASAGYLAAAPDLFYWGGRMRCLLTTMRQVTAREGDAFTDISTVRGFLADHAACTGRIGVIGFCLGGGFAVVLAATGEFDASSVNYGDVPKDAMTLLAEACPVVGSFGAKDPTLRKAPDRLEAALTTHGIDHDITVYPDAGHSFLNDHDPADTPRWAVVMGAVSRSDYHQASAEDARRRIVAFFDRHLGTG